MKLSPFGRTDLQVSNLGLAAAGPGARADERTAHEILDTFCAAGGNFIQATLSDEANASEVHLGNWMAARDVMRNELVLAGKLVLRPELLLSAGTLADHVRRCCEASLRRLRTGYFDLLWYEMRPGILPMDAVWEALLPLIDSGLVRHVGVAHPPLSRFRAALRNGHAWHHLAAIQDDYSVVARSLFESRISRLCAETGAAFVASSPLAGGFLTDAAGPQSEWVAVGGTMRLGGDGRVSRRPGLRDIIERIARARGATIAQTALAWVVNRPGVTAAMVAVNSPAELRMLLEGMEQPLSERDEALLQDPLADWVAVELDRHPAGASATPPTSAAPAMAEALS